MFVGYFTLLDPDPDPACKSGYGSRGSIESGSTTLLDGMTHNRPAAKTYKTFSLEE
jgi:hypothetical protein